jgi:adenine/guanine phosphoribosyltransferase-like PRPP-binding protein
VFETAKNPKSRLELKSLHSFDGIIQSGSAMMNASLTRMRPWIFATTFKTFRTFQNQEFSSETSPRCCVIPSGWAEVMDRLGGLCDSLKPDLIVGIEARGFIVGMGLATHKKLGFVPVRKPGKLPGKVYGIDYALEYGTDRLEIHADAMRDQPRILIVDDLLATGGTASATLI